MSGHATSDDTKEPPHTDDEKLLFALLARDLLRYSHGNTKTWEGIISAVKNQLTKTIQNPHNLEPTQYKQFYYTMKSHAKHDYGFGLFPFRKPQ